MKAIFDKISIIFYRLESFYYDLINFFQNVYYLRKSLIKARSWDYWGLYSLMYEQLIRMEISHRVYGITLNHLETARDIRICIHLLKRLMEDDYSKFDLKFTNANVFDYEVVPKYWFPQNTGKQGYKLAASLEKQDRELLFRLMAKHSKSWWQ